jgi:hypothetical protein
MTQVQRKASFGERWSAARPTKVVLFWCCVASVIATMIVGFGWGGWVMGSTARKMVDTQVDSAVVSRLAPMCALQVSQDPKKSEKLKALKEIGVWEQGEYVKKQGWATLPGGPAAEDRVAEACAKLIIQ